MNKFLLFPTVILISCGYYNTDSYCNNDFEQNLILDDNDCDGIKTTEDCDDDNAYSTSILADADCDGTVTLEDCDDDNPTSKIISEDGDCDDAITAEDCDDDNPSSTIVSEDGDCDGTITAEDCDDDNPSSTIVSEDGDCDGTITAEDCDDEDRSIGNNESDCDTDNIEDTPLEAAAIGFEYIGTWDQNNASLGGWTFDSGEAADAYVNVHITNMDFFSSGAGDDNENICTMLATFINEPAVLDAQEYPWSNPPSNASQYPLDGTSAATWGGFEGYLTFLGFSSDTSDTCARLEDERIYTVTDEGYAVITIEGMHFGLSYGALTAEHESRLSESYETSQIGDYFEDNKSAFVSQYIHINHSDVNATDGFDFTGYDWNYARLAAVNTDGTIGTVPCDWDDTLDCYDLVEYDGTKNVFSASDAFWYEDFPNLDFDILNLGVPELN
jgi:hypothetical protein